jgi:hypothetical protein
MGVTIHFQGKLRSADSYRDLIERAISFGTRRGWRASQIPEAQRTLNRVKDEEAWDYSGFTKGIELHPHFLCEPVRWEFDEEYFIQEYTKTQFAPIEVHIAIVELLREVAGMFESLSVTDEGEFYETNDRAILSGHIDWCNNAIARQRKQNPDLRSAFRLPSGRIVDLIQ